MGMKTSPITASNAFLCRNMFRNIAKDNNIRWCEPHVTTSCVGEVIFEWWCGEKKLTIYVEENNIEYIKVWGSNIHFDMEDGNLDEFLPLLKWLTT